MICRWIAPQELHVRFPINEVCKLWYQDVYENSVIDKMSVLSQLNPIKSKFMKHLSDNLRF